MLYRIGPRLTMLRDLNPLRNPKWHLLHIWSSVSDILLFLQGRKKGTTSCLLDLFRGILFLNSKISNYTYFLLFSILLRLDLIKVFPIKNLQNILVILDTIFISSQSTLFISLQVETIDFYKSRLLVKYIKYQLTIWQFELKNLAPSCCSL